MGFAFIAVSFYCGALAYVWVVEKTNSPFLGLLVSIPAFTGAEVLAALFLAFLGFPVPH